MHRFCKFTRSLLDPQGTTSQRVSVQLEEIDIVPTQKHHLILHTIDKNNNLQNNIVQTLEKQVHSSCWWHWELGQES